VLYWFRTPPNVRVGREPFDPDLRRALEIQNPGVSFDWKKIVETPIPSADAERWRERRRLERAERTSRISRTSVPGGEPPDDGDLTVDAAEQQADSLEPTEESLVLTAASIEPATDAPVAEPHAKAEGHPHAIQTRAGGAIGDSTARALRRHRRRRHGRRAGPRELGSRETGSPELGAPREPSEPSEPREPIEPGEPRESREPREPGE
jgi:hypothetical protein